VLATVLALLASIMWGSYDFGNGILSRRTSFWNVVLVVTGSAAVAMLITVVLLDRPAPSATTMAILAAGGVLSATSSFAYFRALTFTKMSVAAPIIAGAAVVPVLWGLARGDHPHALQLAGIVVTLAGIVVISLPGPTARDDHMPVTLTGVLLTVASSVCAGLMVVALDYGAASDPVWAAAGVRWAAAAWAAVWVGAVRPRLRPQRRLLPLMALMSLLLVAANLLFTEATTLADLSIVAVLGWIGPAVTVLLACLFLCERLRPFQWVAALTVLAGVVLLTAG
jgi:drug/metabolite transporter (DMT)-like permease